jgi:hypothetical protein
MTHRSIFVIGIVVCLSLMSCDLFKTRTPAEPSQQSSNYIPPTDPSIVLQNMTSAFQDGNAVNYTKSFSSNYFLFTPSASARNKYGIDWTTWSKAQEQQCFEKILNHFSTKSKVVLTFELFTPTYSNNTSQVETDYHLTLPSDAGVIKKFNGRVQYTLAQDQSGLWYINQWVDVGTTVSDSTWSDFKGVAFSQW